MKARTVKEVLIAAKWILENVGWTQGTRLRDAYGQALYNPPYCMGVIDSACALGAICLVEVDRFPLTGTAIRALSNEIRARIDVSDWASDNNIVSSWNDTEWRTLSEVVDMFTSAIESEE